MGNDFKKLKIVKDDAWLEPVAREVYERYERYLTRKKQIENEYGSLLKFADAHNYFGIHYSSTDKGWYYREWAPRARDLYFFGDFNNWQRTSHRMELKENGVWEIFLPEEIYADRLVHESRVKVLVHGENGWYERIPVYITRVVQDEETKVFSGQLWFPEKKFNWRGDKFSIGQLDELYIYECHVGMAQEKEAVGTYIEFAENILPRIKAQGYNAIQMMAVAEHPYYGSFGYHVSNFFAPSSRFGTPEELKALIKKAHSMGIAVIMDIVHSHTVKNFLEGINEFDGQPGLYLHEGERGDHPSWDSKLFNYGKTEVLRFLLSNVKYWMREFHFDGFRFDGVTSMLYFHHGYISDWNQDAFFRDGVEWDAITYMQLANALIKQVNRHAVSIAEDVSGMPGLCNPTKHGGIGFDYRLGMGIPDYWTKVLKEKKDEEWNVWELWDVMVNRKFDIKTVAYAESHDQALVGDKTLAFQLMDANMYDHMGVDDHNLTTERGVSMHKIIRFFTLTLGGEAWLNFMGNEFGHPEWIDFPREGNNWSHWYARRQWSLVDNPNLKYKFLNEFDKDMLALVQDNKILSAGYPRQLWMDDWHKTIVFERNGLVFTFNFHINISPESYEVPVPTEGNYQVVFSSDAPAYGGYGRLDADVLYPAEKDADGNWKIKIYNINRTALVFKRVEA